MRLVDAGDEVVGAKLIAIGRRIGKPFIIADSSTHRARRVDVSGKPAICYVDKPHYLNKTKPI